MPLTSSQKYSGKLNKTFEHIEQKKCYSLFDGQKPFYTAHFSMTDIPCGSNKYEAKSNGMTKIMDLEKEYQN